MTIKRLKKYAKARHTYGHSPQGIKMEMKELSHLRWSLKHNLYFWTHNWNKKRKFLRKHREYIENGFGFIILKKNNEKL